MRALPVLVLGLAAVALAGPAGAQDLAGSGGWRLETLDGQRVTWAELADGPVVLNAWATWCLPCVAELRSLEALAASPEARGVRFVLVSPEDGPTVATWVARRGYRLPFYVEGSRIPDAFGLRALPTTWIVDGDGRVVLKRRGAADWDRAEVRALLASLTRDP